MIQVAIVEQPEARAHGARPAGSVQGWVLVAVAWLAVIASSLIAPVLPRLAATFHGTPGLDVRISLVATLPALFVALLAAPFGLIGDRIGFKRILVPAVAIYGVVGTSPMWLTTLDQVIGSRVLVGVTEAAIMTASTALISIYFHGAARQRWLAMQTGTAPLVSITVLALGGLLGEQGWRAPFAIYGFGFLLIPLAAFLVFDPERTKVERAAEAARETTRAHWLTLAGICAVTVFAMTCFLIPIIQSGFLLSERGLTSPRAIGLWTAATQAANPLGALLFGLTRWRYPARLAFAFGFLTAGFATIALSAGYPAVIAGAAIANLGAGFILPTLITWALRAMPVSASGRAAGLWQSACFFGQFLSPLAVVALTRALGSLDRAVLAYAVACGGCALVAALAWTRRPGGAIEEAAAPPLRTVRPF